MYSDFNSYCTDNNACDFQIHDYIILTNTTSTETTAAMATCLDGTAKVYM